MNEVKSALLKVYAAVREARLTVSSMPVGASLVPVMVTTTSIGSPSARPSPATTVSLSWYVWPCPRTSTRASSVTV